MNTTITNINDNTMNMKVREYTKYLISNKGKMFKAIFTKKNGEEREMTFTIATGWNNLNGIATTVSGAKMVASKCAKNIATVCEKVKDSVKGGAVVFQPRSLNLASIKSLVVC